MTDFYHLTWHLEGPYLMEWMSCSRRNMLIAWWPAYSIEQAMGRVR